MKERKKDSERETALRPLNRTMNEFARAQRIVTR